MKAKHVILSGLILMSLIVSAINVQSEILGPVSVKDRLGNGWHMQTETYVSDDGLVSGLTKITNYNNAFGFTGGLFVVVLDSQMRPIYTTPMHKWGINAAGFSKKRERNAVWTEQIPSGILEDAASIAVIQQHTPTNRVWVWIYENRELIIDKALDFIELFKKIKADTLTEEDVWDAVYSVAELIEATDNDSWAMQNAEEICAVVRNIRDLAADLDGWKPNNHEDLKYAAQAVIDICRNGFDWGDEQEITRLVETISGLVGADKKDYLPENIYELQNIIENIYVITNDERVPENVQNTIRTILEKFNGTIL